jgi:hypothetical protein
MRVSVFVFISVRGAGRHRGFNFFLEEVGGVGRLSSGNRIDWDRIEKDGVLRELTDVTFVFHPTAEDRDEGEGDFVPF